MNMYKNISWSSKFFKAPGSKKKLHFGGSSHNSLALVQLEAGSDSNVTSTR